MMFNRLGKQNATQHGLFVGYAYFNKIHFGYGFMIGNTAASKQLIIFQQAGIIYMKDGDFNIELGDEMICSKII